MMIALIVPQDHKAVTFRSLPVNVWKTLFLKRIRKQFETRAEAIAYENAQMEEAKARPWSGDKEELSTQVLTGSITVQQSEP
ncbi:hypothetical protein ABW286_07975 [Erwinia papayae]|uniref:Uncharacterized protein n=1 Tax=Erwinia papayae TaxID=206499 RepID=A0ABV3N002_9GAMM